MVEKIEDQKLRSLEGKGRRLTSVERKEMDSSEGKKLRREKHRRGRVEAPQS